MPSVTSDTKSANQLKRSCLSNDQTLLEKSYYYASCPYCPKNFAKIRDSVKPLVFCNMQHACRTFKSAAYYKNSFLCPYEAKSMLHDNLTHIHSNNVFWGRICGTTSLKWELLPWASIFTHVEHLEGKPERAGSGFWEMSLCEKWKFLCLRTRALQIIWQAESPDSVHWANLDPDRAFSSYLLWWGWLQFISFSQSHFKNDPGEMAAAFRKYLNDKKPQHLSSLIRYHMWWVKN